ncbi:MAG: helix-turn-helix domain-containing protein [Elusimicrobia bacterium]|nr:helix-turn-helix domain-containing protein [Elusimicrobiota bacterium]
MQIRRRRGLSQRALAELAGVGQGHVQRVEAGLDRRVSTLKRLLAAMGCKPLLALAPLTAADCESP